VDLLSRIPDQHRNLCPPPENSQKVLLGRAVRTDRLAPAVSRVVVVDKIRTNVTSDEIHTLFLGCVVISRLEAEEAEAFACACRSQTLPRLPRAMPLSFFLDLASAFQPQLEPLTEI
jgi:hypothetical protein